MVGSGIDGDCVLPSDHSNTAAIMIGYVFCEYGLPTCSTLCRYSTALIRSNPPAPPQSWCHGHLNWFLLLVRELITPVSSNVAHHQYSKQTQLMDH